MMYKSKHSMLTAKYCFQGDLLFDSLYVVEPQVVSARCFRDMCCYSLIHIKYMR